MDLLENGYLCYRAKQYDIRGRKYLRTNGKYYIVDSRLRRNTIDSKDDNYSNRLENIVYTELLRRGYMVDVGLLDNKRIVFITWKIDETLYVQVAYELPTNMHTIDKLLHINDNYKKIVVTGRYYETEQIEGSPIISIMGWLMSE